MKYKVKYNANIMKIIIITGTPGTGKSTVSALISEKLGFKHIDVKKLIKAYRLSEYYDKIMKCKVVDVKKLNKLLTAIIKSERFKGTKGLVIDSHLSHYLPCKYVNLCIVTKCALAVLKKRLKKRNYSAKKVRENLDCEIFDICLVEATAAKHSCMIVDTTKGVNAAKILKQLKICLKWA